MVNPINNNDLLRIVNHHIQKRLQKKNVPEMSFHCNMTYGESLFHNFVVKNSTENLISIICFCVDYEITISGCVTEEKKSIKNISLAIAESLFDLKFNFSLTNLMLLTRHLVDNEIYAVSSDESAGIINIKQAATELSMSVQTIRKRAKRGEIPTFGNSVKGYRFEKAVLLEWGRNYRK